MIITVKNEAGEDVQMLDIVAVAKGLIQPGDLANGGALSPQAASRLISMIASDAFLAKVLNQPMDRLERNIDAIDVASRQLVRVPEGQEPTDDQLAGAGEHGAVLRALTVQLFATLTLSWLRANKDNPNLQTEVEKGFTTRLTSDLVDLACNGENDDGGGVTQAEKFLRLNKGWVQIAKDAAATHKLDIDAATDGWQGTLGAIMDAGEERFRANSVFVMNTADADAYARELGGHVTGTPLTADSPLRRYQGKAIEAHEHMPQGHVMFTPLKNLAYGLPQWGAG